MLRKVDCVMIYVEDLDRAERFYCHVFGLRKSWRDIDQVGLAFPETDAEIVLHTDPGIPHRVEVHYLVDDVDSFVGWAEQNGCTVSVRPFDIAIGRCAVIADPFGTTLCVLDMSRGPRLT